MNDRNGSMAVFQSRLILMVINRSQCNEEQTPRPGLENSAEAGLLFRVRPEAVPQE